MAGTAPSDVTVALVDRSCTRAAHFRTLDPTARRAIIHDGMRLGTYPATQSVDGGETDA